jgi:hypothetical protein
VAHTYNPNYSAEVRKIAIQSQPWANSLGDPISKNIKSGSGSKRLPSEHESLSENNLTMVF